MSFTPLPTRIHKRRKALQAPDCLAPQPLHVFAELELEVTMLDAQSNPVYVNGRADWALGYSTSSKALDGAVLVAIEAKRRENFGAAEAQLLTYLAILRQLRVNAGKQNCIAQGCYTDGKRYAFVCIDNDGHVATSNVYDIRGDVQRNLVFNFIVTILETALRTSPTTSLVKKEDRGADVEQVGETLYRDSDVFRIGELEVLHEAQDPEGILQEIPDIYPPNLVKMHISGR